MSREPYNETAHLISEVSRIADALETIAARMTPRVVYKTDAMLSPTEAQAIEGAIADGSIFSEANR